LIFKPVNPIQIRRKETAPMLRVQAISSLSLILMGSMDWLTTIIGIAYFGAVEVNPFIADITGTSLPAFTALKLSATVIVGLLFYTAEKMLLRTHDKSTSSFQSTRFILKGAYITTMALLLVAVLNNLTVVLQAP
jgi:hypothetical protein